MDGNTLCLIIGIIIGIIISNPRARQWFLIWWRRGKKEESCSTEKTATSSGEPDSSPKK